MINLGDHLLKRDLENIGSSSFPSQFSVVKVTGSHRKSSIKKSSERSAEDFYVIQIERKYQKANIGRKIEY